MITNTMENILFTNQLIKLRSKLLCFKKLGCFVRKPGILICRCALSTENAEKQNIKIHTENEDSAKHEDKGKNRTSFFY